MISKYAFNFKLRKVFNKHCIIIRFVTFYRRVIGIKTLTNLENPKKPENLAGF